MATMADQNSPMVIKETERSKERHAAEVKENPYSLILGKTIKRVDDSCVNTLKFYFTDGSHLELETVRRNYGIYGFEPNYASGKESKAVGACVCAKGDPCDYHAATCVVCPGGKCQGHPEVYK
jgi:hypothetical protein